MIFNIAPANAERAPKCFTAERNPHNYGYKKSAILTPKNKRLFYTYQIDIIDTSCIVCTVRHQESGTLVAVVKLSGYTAESIEVEKGDLYRNCSNYPYRTEYNNRYLKKYDQIACIVHGAITAGLLFDEEQPETAPEPIQAGETTPAPVESQDEPKNAPTSPATVSGGEETPTEQAKPEDVQTLLQLFRAFYNELYEKEEAPDPATRAAADAIGREYCRQFDEYSQSRPAILAAFTEARQDFITSDREAAAFMLALEALKEAQNGPKEGKTTEPTPTEERPENRQENPTTEAPTPVDTPPAYIVQCRSPRRPWTDYSSPATLAECETIKGRAEARRTCDVNGDLLTYRIIPTDGAPTAVEERPEPTPAAVEETTPESWTRPTDSGPDSVPTPVDVLPIRQAESPGGRDGQTPTETPKTARNSPEKAEPLQTTTHDGNGPKKGKKRPYTPRPEISTIYTRGSPVKTINPMTTGQGGQL